jgi:hypothetical protein
MKMAMHIADIEIDRELYDRVNRLLEIPSLSDMTDNELLQAGANTDQYEGIFCVDFDDGSELTWDLCSGNENYFDDVVWTGNDGHMTTLECTFELSDIEFKAHNGETYAVRIHVIDHASALKAIEDFLKELKS